MTNRNQKVFLISMVLSVLGFGSCQKQGCTDIDAVNYNVDAKKDDGTCTYEGSAIFWYGEATSDALIIADAVSLTYYVDGQIVGSSAANVYWNGTAPECGTTGLVTVTKDLGHVKTQAYNYQIKDQDNWTFWEGTLNFNANECKTIELVP